MCEKAANKRRDFAVKTVKGILNKYK